MRLMRITPATFCALLVLGGCERGGDQEAGAKLDRSDKDTVTTTAEAGDTAPAADDPREPQAR
jgi:hypothetical protein